MTADPAGDGLNWYAYVGGDPVNGSDPRGLSCESLGRDHGAALTGCIDLPAGQTLGAFLQQYSSACPDGHVCADMPLIDPVVEAYMRWYKSALGSGSSPLVNTGSSDEPDSNRYSLLAQSLRDAINDPGIRMNECEALASFAYDNAFYLDSFIMPTAVKLEQFVSSFAVMVPATDQSVQRFNQFAQTVGIRRIGTVVGAVYIGYTGDGFQPEYRDILGTEQSHHFAAFFQMGFSVGSAIGQAASIYHDFPFNPGDMNLGMRAAQLGAQLKAGELSPFQVAQQIGRLCQ